MSSTHTGSSSSSSQVSIPDKHESFVVRVEKDSRGYETRLAQTTWRGQTLVHPCDFYQVPVILEGLQGYQPLEDDVWLCAYPKSGTNWLYEIMSIILSDKAEPAKHVKMYEMIESLPSFSDIDKIPPPRVLNTHIIPRFLPEQLFKRKVVFPIRNPLSVALSFYYHRGNDKTETVKYMGTIREYMLTMLYDDDGGIPDIGNKFGINIFGTWYDYVIEWWATQRNNPNVLFLFYEDMKKHPYENIERVSKFLGKSHPRDFLEKVVELTEINTMKKTSRQKIDAAYLTETLDFFRKGQVDEWKEHVTKEDFELYKGYYMRRLKHFPDLIEQIEFE